MDEKNEAKWLDKRGQKIKYNKSMLLRALIEKKLGNGQGMVKSIFSMIHCIIYA